MMFGDNDVTVWCTMKGILVDHRLRDMVKDVQFGKVGQKTTIALMTLKNGFEIVGTSACVDPKIYDYEIGASWALKSALDELEKYEGYQRQMQGVE